jgi:hypothetical protein
MSAQDYEKHMRVWAVEDQGKFYGKVQCSLCPGWLYSSSKAFKDSESTVKMVSVIAKDHFAAIHGKV